MDLDSKLTPTNLPFWGMESKKITVEEPPLSLMREEKKQDSPWALFTMAAVLGLCLGVALMGQ